MKHKLSNAYIAVLSSCHSVSNDFQQPDESINLASTLMSIGFSSIVGTKWSVLLFYDNIFMMTDKLIDLGQWQTLMDLL